MTQPREIIQGATYFLTRRILQRKFLLRPDAAITAFIRYSLAMAAKRHDIQINAFCAMSTHIHMVVTDPAGVLPRFLQYFHHLVAMGTKLLRHWRGPVWDHARTSVVRLLTPQAIAEKIAYTLANPVAARAVQYAHQWPGAKNLVSEIGDSARPIPRPNVYFTPRDSKWPRNAALQIHLPPTFMDAVAFRKNIGERISDEEKKAHKAMRRRTKHKKNRAATISPYRYATSKESSFAHNPSFAVGANNKAAFEAALTAIRTFRRSYRMALTRWRNGDRDASFPRGTWWMRVFHGANVENEYAKIASTEADAAQSHHDHS